MIKLKVHICNHEITENENLKCVAFLLDDMILSQQGVLIIMPFWMNYCPYKMENVSV